MTASRIISRPVYGADLAVSALEREGVGYVFGLPGTTIMDLIDATAGRERIRFVSVRHEQTAAFMADGFARASGDVGVCMASRGPGAANLAIGIHNAFAESVPVVALVGQVPDSVHHRDAFEEMDLVRFFEPMTKWAVEVHKPERIPELLQRALRTARGGRPRPVLASLPLDTQQAAVSDVGLQPRMEHRAAVPDADDLLRAVELLARGERPLILAGGGMLGPQHEPGLIALAEALSAPVATTWLRKTAFPNQHPLFVGSLGYGAVQATERALQEADVILALGCRFSEFTTKRWMLVPEAATLIHIDLDPAELGRNYVPALALQGDARRATAAMAAIGAGGGVEPTEHAARVRASYLAQTRLADESGSSPVGSAEVVRELTRALDRHRGILVQDAHSFGPWVARYLSFDRAGSYFAAAGGSMGWGLPAALGVQLARPDERVIAVCGDGSFWMVAQDLETAVREALPVVVVVTNNFSYGNTRDRQTLAHGGRYLGVFYDNPDFAAFARLLGAHGERVERGDELGPALERALAAHRPAVVDVIQDRFEGLPADLQPPAAR